MCGLFYPLLPLFYLTLNSGGSRGGARGGGGAGAPLFVDQTVARRAEKDFQTDFPPPPISDDRSLTLSEGLDPPLLKHAHCM